MKKTHFLLLLAVVCALFSCSKESTDVKSTSGQLKDIVNGRMAFTNSADFRQYTHMLSSMKQEDLDKLAGSCNFASLNKALCYYDGKDEEMVSELAALDSANFPNFLRFILNAKGEVLIGDSISWFTQGKQFFIHKNDVARLDILKKNPVGTRFVTARAELVRAIAKPTTETIISPSAGVDGKYQHEFQSVYPAAGNRKYVIESWAYVLNADFYLTLRIKMEYKGRGSWKPAGDLRMVVVNINTTANLSNPATGGWLYSNSATFNTSVLTTSNYEINLGSYDNPPQVSNIYWDLSVFGQIEQHIDTDILANYWITSGQLW